MTELEQMRFNCLDLAVKTRAADMDGVTGDEALAVAKKFEEFVTGPAPTPSAE